MGLKKSVTNSAGVTAEYWRINGLHFDIDQRVIVADLALYLTQDARMNGMAIFSNRSVYGLPLTKTESESCNLLQVVYEKLKQFSDFQDAEDC